MAGAGRLVRPDRDFPLLLDLDPRGSLPLDRLISDRLPLDAIQTGIDRLREGSTLRTIVEPL